MVSQSVSQSVRRSVRIPGMNACLGKRMFVAVVVVVHLSFCRYKRYFEVCNTPYFLIASFINYLVSICISVNHVFLGRAKLFHKPVCPSFAHSHTQWIGFVWNCENYPFFVCLYVSDYFFFVFFLYFRLSLSYLSITSLLWTIFLLSCCNVLYLIYCKKN